MSASRDAAAGAVEGLSTVTPTGLGAAVASSATGKDIKPPIAGAAAGAVAGPSTSTTSSPASSGGTTTGGAGMSAVSEAKGLLAQASQHVESAQGAVQQVISELQEMLQTFLAAMEESDQGEADAALAQIQQAITQAEELAQAVGVIPQSLEGIQL